jgi:hypothetical protein
MSERGSCRGVGALLDRAGAHMLLPTEKNGCPQPLGHESVRVNEKQTKNKSNPEEKNAKLYKTKLELSAL